MRLDLIEESDLPVQVGRFRLTGLLGSGGMARVFRAEMSGDLGFVKPAALKVVLAGRADRTEALQAQLVQEARVGALLNHPNVVHTFDIGSFDGLPWIAMELVEGLSLGQLVEAAGPLPPAIALELAAQVCLGLAHAHEAQHEGRPLRVVHRDIKPSNLLVRGDGLVKIVDFGIAKAAVGDVPTTSTGLARGTPAYMAPEQLAGDPLDGRCDLFALGAVVWLALTGRMLFAGRSITEVMMRIAQADETLARAGVFDVADRLHPGLGPVLRRLLAGDREGRYGSAAEAAAALESLRGPAQQRALGALVSAELSREAVAAHTLVAAVGPTTAEVPWTPAAVESEARGPATAEVPWTPADPAAEPSAAAAEEPSAAASAEEPSAAASAEEPSAAAPAEEPVPASSAEPAPTATRDAMPAQTVMDDEDDLAWRPRRRGRGIAVAGLLLLAAGAAAVLHGPDGSEAPDLMTLPEPPRLDPPVERATPTPRRATKRSSRKAKPTPRRPPAAAAAPAVTPTPAAPTPTAAPTPAAPTPTAAPSPTPISRGGDPAESVPTPSPAATPAPRATPADARAHPAPTAEPTELAIAHAPVRSARPGQTLLIEAAVHGPAGTSVVLQHESDAGTGRVVLRPSAPGRFGASFTIPANAGSSLRYWIVASHPEATPRRRQNGTRFEPHRVFIVR